MFNLPMCVEKRYSKKLYLNWDDFQTNASEDTVREVKMSEMWYFAINILLFFRTKQAKDFKVIALEYITN